MREMIELRKQIHRILLEEDPSVASVLEKPLLPPNATQANLVRQIVTASYLDHVARKMTPSEMREVDLPRGKVPYVTTSLNENTPCFIHRESFVLPLKTSDFVFNFKSFKHRINILTCLSSRIWFKRMAGTFIFDNSFKEFI